MSNARQRQQEVSFGRAQFGWILPLQLPGQPHTFDFNCHADRQVIHYACACPWPTSHLRHLSHPTPFGIDVQFPSLAVAPQLETLVGRRVCGRGHAINPQTRKPKLIKSKARLVLSAL